LVSVYQPKPQDAEEKVAYRGDVTQYRYHVNQLDDEILYVDKRAVMERRRDHGSVTRAIKTVEEGMERDWGRGFRYKAKAQDFGDLHGLLVRAAIVLELGSEPPQEPPA
jgi:hypothetical protein